MTPACRLWSGWPSDCSGCRPAVCRCAGYGRRRLRGRARLGFADGTVVVARSHGQGMFGVLARHTADGDVRPGKVVLRDEWIELELVWPGRRMVVDVLGTDQAD